jgi:hypothetical protein
MRITHIGPLSVGKVSFVLYGAIGLVIGAGFAVFGLLGAAVGGEEVSNAPLLGAIFGVGAIVFLPLLYGGLGALSGIVMAWLYNLVAGLVGGVEIRTDDTPTA